MTTTPESPHDAVLRWWKVLQAGDLHALRLLTCDDFVSTGGPKGRVLGAEPFLEEAQRFFDVASVDGWSVSEVEVRQHGQTAICSYVWDEAGVHRGRPFELRGVATDFLVLTASRWAHQAHHVSLLDDTHSQR